MPLYLTLELSALFIPLLLSFDKKVAFYKLWPALFISVVLTGIFFILVDIYFTSRGIWGFKPEHHTNVVIAGLPLEEWLFFIIIPYASIFIHYVLAIYFPKLILPVKVTRIISIILIITLIILAIFYHKRLYSLFYFSLMALVISVSLFSKSGIINRFYLTYLVILIPFFIINGILTGSFITEEVVWYNRSEIMGIRIFTVPVEDVSYGFCLILINLLLINIFNKLMKIRYPA